MMDCSILFRGNTILIYPVNIQPPKVSVFHLFQYVFRYCARQITDFREAYVYISHKTPGDHTCFSGTIGNWTFPKFWVLGSCKFNCMLRPVRSRFIPASKFHNWTRWTTKCPLNLVLNSWKPLMIPVKHLCNPNIAEFPIHPITSPVNLLVTIELLVITREVHRAVFKYHSLSSKFSES